MSAEGPLPVIESKLLEAQRSVEAVVKRGHNQDQNYSYATAADVVQVARDALHAAGLLPAIVDVFDVEQERFERGGSKAPGLNVSLRVALRITCEDSGRWLEFIAAGAGADYGGGDKAILKAQTAATKYAYSNALSLPFADHDPERDAGGAARLPEQTPDPDKGIDESKIGELQAAIQTSRVGFARLCTIIGGVGAEAPKIRRADSIRKALAELSAEQAEQILNVLDAIAKGALEAEGKPEQGK